MQRCWTLDQIADEWQEEERHGMSTLGFADKREVLNHFEDELARFTDVVGCRMDRHDVDLQAGRGCVEHFTGRVVSGRYVKGAIAPEYWRCNNTQQWRQRRVRRRQQVADHRHWRH